MNKQELIDENRYINVDYDEWCNAVYEGFYAVCDILGIEVRHPQFSGFSSQGDGASFIGRYRSYRWVPDTYKKALTSEEAPVRIRAHAPQDEELHRIADALCTISRIYYPVYADIKRGSTRYSHSATMHVDAGPQGENEEDWPDEVHEVVQEQMTDLMRALADWFYGCLETEYDYRTSDEAVWEAIEANKGDD